MGRPTSCTLLVCVTAVAVMACVANAGPIHKDQVLHLPGVTGELNFAQYSGYLNAQGAKKLHYWFVESQDKPRTDPVILWLNGGPGCSSLDGLLAEHGPFLASEDGQTLENNPYAWNKHANVVYLESPAGVGFSYSEDEADYGTDDDTVADDAYTALLNFFDEYAEFSKAPFYIMGESYGGIYVPTLAKAVLEGNKSGKHAIINLKAIGVGNGMDSYELNDNSNMYFAYYHGLIGDELWAKMNANCCTDGQCQFAKPATDDCMVYTQEAAKIIYQSGINFYDIYRDCYPNKAAAMSTLQNNFRSLNLDLLQTTPLGGNFGMDVPCIDSQGSMNYLNRPEVKKAINVRMDLPRWEICSEVVGQKYNRTYQTVKPVYEEILPEIRALIFSGDTDMACNFLGSQWFVESLGRQVLTERKPWVVNGQVAGFIKKFDSLTFMTFKGAGHMVPQWKPVEADYMLEQFLKGDY